MRVLHGARTVVIAYLLPALVSVMCGWTLIWVAVWVGGVVAVLGFVAGLLDGSSIGMGVVPANPGSLGLAAAPVGAVVGGAAGFMDVFEHVIGWHAIATSLTTGVVVAIGITVIATLCEPVVMRLHGYRRVTDSEARYLDDLVCDVRDGMDITILQTILVSDNVIPGALGYSRHLVLTTGALSLGTRPCSALIAHELGHFKHRDALVDRFVWALGFPVAVLIGLRVAITANGTGRFRIITALLLWPAMVLSRWVIGPVLAWRSWRCEYRADACAVDAGYARALIRLLQDVQAFEHRPSGWVSRPTPSAQLRIAAIEQHLMMVSECETA